MNTAVGGLCGRCGLPYSMCKCDPYVDEQEFRKRKLGILESLSESLSIAIKEKVANECVAIDEGKLAECILKYANLEIYHMDIKDRIIKEQTELKLKDLARYLVEHKGEWLCTTNVE
jgi:hypothetical protein